MPNAHSPFALSRRWPSNPPRSPSLAVMPVVYSSALEQTTPQNSAPRLPAGVANEKPHPVQRVTEFPQSPAADDVVSDRIIFEIGDSRFAIQWTAEIEGRDP